MTVDYDDECPMSDINKWKKILACNRCFDFYTAYNALGRKIGDAMASLAAARNTHRYMSSNDRLEKIERDTRAILEVITKKLASLLAGFYRTVNQWDEEMVNLLMDKPDAWQSIVRTLKRGAETQVRQQQEYYANQQ